MSFTLPPLPYAYDALEPHIDARTMEIHHTKHHQAYINTLNTALAEAPDIAHLPIETIIAHISTLPEGIQAVVRNHGGGHYNHSLFWNMLSAQPTQPSNELMQAITDTFGSLEALQAQFTDAALKRFGSGWAWLVADAEGKLMIRTTPNQDNPCMEDQTLTILLGLDVWEHAYYLHYQNRRQEYCAAFWHVVNWEFASQQYQKTVAI